MFLFLFLSIFILLYSIYLHFILSYFIPIIHFIPNSFSISFFILYFIYFVYFTFIIVASYIAPGTLNLLVLVSPRDRNLRESPVLVSVCHRNLRELLVLVSVFHRNSRGLLVLVSGGRHFCSAARTPNRGGGGGFPPPPFRGPQTPGDGKTALSAQVAQISQ